MSGLGRKKALPKVVSFRPAWLDENIEGTKVSMWLRPDPSDKGRGTCTLCPAPNSFSINEGLKAVKQHFSTAKHQRFLTASQTESNCVKSHLFSANCMEDKNSFFLCCPRASVPNH